MKKHYSSFLYFLFFCLPLLWVGCNPTLVEQKNDFDFKVIETGSISKLRVKTFNGGITVRPSSDSKLHLKSTLRQPDQIDYTIKKSDTEILIEAEQNKRDVRPIPGATFEIQVPYSMQLDLSSSNGSIILSYLESDAKIKTSYGSVSINESTGSYDIELKDGSIYLDSVQGELKVRTNKGDIELKSPISATSIYDLQTKTGDIYLSLANKGLSEISIQAITKNSPVRNFSSIIDIDPDEQKFISLKGKSSPSLKAKSNNGFIEIDSY